MRRAALRAWAQGTKAKPTARHVYMALLLWANGDGWAWPSVAALVEVTGLGRATVKRGLAELVTLGELERDRRVGFTDRYRITHPAQSEPTHPAHSGRNWAHSEPRVGSERAPKVVTNERKEVRGAAALPRNKSAAAPNKSAPPQPTTVSNGTHLPGSGTLRWASEVIAARELEQ